METPPAKIPIFRSIKILAIYSLFQQFLTKPIAGILLAKDEAVDFLLNPFPFTGKRLLQKSLSGEKAKERKRLGFVT